MIGRGDLTVSSAFNDKLRSVEFIKEIQERIKDPLKSFIDEQIHEINKTTVQTCISEARLYTKKTVKDQLGRHKLDVSFDSV